MQQQEIDNSLIQWTCRQGANQRFTSRKYHCLPLQGVSLKEVFFVLTRFDKTVPEVLDSEPEIFQDVTPQLEGMRSVGSANSSN